MRAPAAPVIMPPRRLPWRPSILPRALPSESMPAHRVHWSWSSSARQDPIEAARGLEERLRECAQDRAASARQVALEAAGILVAWLGERPRAWGEGDEGRARAAIELETGWAAWAQDQAWRGPCAQLLDDLRRTFHGCDWRRSGGLREALEQELEAWPQLGERLADPAELVPHALRRLERGQTLLLYAPSEAVVAALGAAQRAGLDPELLLAQGAPDQSGPRAARELAACGLRVRLAWDAAVLGAVADVDQVWLETEALAPDVFAGLVGTSLLAGEAHRHEVPVHVLCTSDALLPAGAALLPAWGAEERWNLWSQGPRSVRVESQPFELASVDTVDLWITEAGPETLPGLCTRRLRTRAAAPCDEGAARSRAAHRPTTLSEADD